jgi:hypothetical protein
MKNLKTKLLTLGVLATVVMSSTPAFAATNSKSNTVQATVISKNSHFKFKKFKAYYREYTYANAPSNVKTQYYNDCKSINKTPSPSDKIDVPITATNSSVIEPNNVALIYSFTYDPSSGNMEVTDPSGIDYYANTSQLVGYRHITTGAPVECLQLLLGELGYSIAIDRIFGDQTQGAVLDFQNKNSLSPDGVTGPNTWNTMLYVLH